MNRCAGREFSPTRLQYVEASSRFYMFVELRCIFFFASIVFRTKSTRRCASLDSFVCSLMHSNTRTWCTVHHFATKECCVWAADVLILFHHVDGYPVGVGQESSARFGPSPFLHVRGAVNVRRKRLPFKFLEEVCLIVLTIGYSTKKQCA